jgi:hypothetical protein
MNKDNQDQDFNLTDAELALIKNSLIKFQDAQSCLISAYLNSSNPLQRLLDPHLNEAARIVNALSNLYFVEKAINGDPKWKTH